MSECAELRRLLDTIAMQGRKTTLLMERLAVLERLREAVDKHATAGGFDNYEAVYHALRACEPKAPAAPRVVLCDKCYVCMRNFKGYYRVGDEHNCGGRFVEYAPVEEKP